MKLKKLAHAEPQTRLAVAIKTSTFDLLEAYRAAYEKNYGNAIEKGQLVDTLLREFISGDKEFMKQHQAALEAAAQPVAAPAPARTPAPAPSPSFGGTGSNFGATA